MKRKAEKIIDIWIKYSNHLIQNGNDMDAIRLRTEAMATTNKLVK